MKVAFVNQPYDRIIPPGQNSVGICTYGLAEPLRRWCDVRVYGIRDQHLDAGKEHSNGVAFSFLPSSNRERFVYKLRGKCAKLVDFRSPVSTSGWLFSDYAHRVALDIRQKGYDVVHIQQCSQYAPIIRALNPDVKIVLHLHAPWFTQSNHRVLRERLQSVDLVTTVSDFVGARFRTAFPGRCETAYNGVNPKDFRAEKDWQALALREQKRVLFVGAVAPHSGVHVLVKAFGMVAAKIPHVQLDIVGPQANYPIEEVFELGDWRSVQSIAPFYRRDYPAQLKASLFGGPSESGTYVGALKAQLEPDLASRIHFAGPIGSPGELIRHYYDADVFAFSPVCNHGFGLPPVEAMAAGTPVVASRSGGLTETIVDGRTGLLVAKDDAPALAGAIMELLENDARREAMGRAARTRILDRFTWDLTAEKLYGLYLDLCGARENRRLIPDLVQFRAAAKQPVPAGSLPRRGYFSRLARH